MPLTRDEVQLRTAGLVTLADEVLIRFGTVESHQVVKTALANADLYGPALQALHLPPQAVLALSCFAVGEGWSPERLATGTRYASYYAIAAAVVRDLGFEMWPTDTFTNGQPDANNPVHFDIIVIRNLAMSEIADRTGSPAQRRALRARLLPTFQRLLNRLEGPRPLSDGPPRYDL